MPKTKKSQKEEKVSAKHENKSFLSEIKWGESYVSLILGAVVVVVAVLLVFTFVKNKGFNKNPDTSSTATQEKTTPKTYEVKAGDDLWTISEKLYGSGYNWVDLAAVNKLDNPSMLYAGTKLSIPEVKPKVVVAQAQVNPKEDSTGSIKGSTYTIKEGDDLWNIAVRAYGDGYKWVDIAKANNLENPDLIFSGNVLKLPR